MKNAYLHLTLDQADWNVSPTHFQASSFPEHYRRRIQRDSRRGGCTSCCSPTLLLLRSELPDGTVLKSGEPIVTFVNRRLRALSRLPYLFALNS